ncbi:hypothetical protein VM98_04070 [Streptomyces rubellomurinus subsp. indigoferus]|uniref:Uncharacterized protein n=1 Tax=Streptomyces rubellomurinus (strain ATCC 31215) TaxID=359131 RepID=A0A0F2TG96_STRR3|nr:hypothetical protein [Streptomyces rubellomurinus]KJS56927.1 hypothetical protein VM98_04070 [Streptomyces rubellomurinus subsp. indigoferus]KJS61270.1 hypothetical protein VM95_16245 [Streptomyces rubellomurinus]
MSERSEPDAPMVNVAAYWRGDFTLRPEGRAEDEPDADAPSLARLGRSGITAHGRDLAALLAPAYDAFLG